MSKNDWDPTEFQKTIQAWLDRTGMSQKAAADTCGFSQSVINRWMQTDRNYLVQPTRDTLEKLAPKIGIDLDELERQAGRRNDPLPKTAKPVELQTLLRDIEAGWHAAPEHEREIRAEVARAALPHTRRPNRRIRGNNAGLERPNVEYRKHKLAA